MRPVPGRDGINREQARLSGKWIKAGLSAALVVLADQLSKYAVWVWLAPHKHVAVIPGLFDLTMAMNTGVAFGMMSGEKTVIRVIGLIVVALFALGVIIYLIHTVGAGERLFLFGLSLIAGGALGNMVDRIRLGAVIDFLDVYIGPYHWPAFNVADAGITVGTGLILIHMWRAWRREAARERE